MGVTLFFATVNALCALPTIIIFVAAALFFTITLRGIQFRAITRFFTLARASALSHLRRGYTGVSLTYAIVSLLGTTIGMGNIIAPSLAILVGGSGALVWLIIFMLMSAAIKYAEVLFTIKTRQTTQEGGVVAGPVQYLQLVAPALSWWYGLLVLVLLPGWSALQAQALAEAGAFFAIAPWLTGLILAGGLLVVMIGHVERIRAAIARWIPALCIMYLVFALMIIVTHVSALLPTLQLMITSAFNMRAVAGAGLFAMLRAAVYRGTFITEAGLGTSCLPHALASTKHAHDQSVFALCAVLADIVIAFISGLLVLVSGVWCHVHYFTTTLVHHAFVDQFGFMGGLFLFIVLAILVFMTIIGNSMSAIQHCIAGSDYRWVSGYVAGMAVIVFCGSLASAELVWNVMDFVLALIAVPTLGGLLWLAISHPQMLRE